MEINKGIYTKHNVYRRLVEFLPAPDISRIEKQVLRITGVTKTTYYRHITDRMMVFSSHIAQALAIVMDCTIEDVLNPNYRFQSLVDREEEELANSLNLSEVA